MSGRSYAVRQSRRTAFALLADGVTFALFAALVGFSGEHLERNALVAAAFASAGVAGVLGLKAAAAALICWRSSRIPVSELPLWRWRVPFALASSLGLAATVVGAGFNLASLADSLWRAS